MRWSPIIDKYDVYEVTDHGKDETFLVAHARGQEKLPSKKISIGGILKEFKVKKEDKEVPEKFLEVLYYGEG